MSSAGPALGRAGASGLRPICTARRLSQGAGAVAPPGPPEHRTRGFPLSNPRHPW
jgi:hypothetical protein